MVRMGSLSTNSSWPNPEAAREGIPIKALKILRRVLKLNKALSPSHLITSQKSEYKERVYGGPGGWMDGNIFPSAGNSQPGWSPTQIVKSGGEGLGPALWLAGSFGVWR